VSLMICSRACRSPAARIPATPPGAVARLLGRPPNSEWHAKSVDRRAYWITSLAPADLLAFIARRGPALRSVASGSGGVRGRTYGWWEELELPVASPLAGPREAFVSIAAAGRGHYAVRVDTVVAWHRLRSASSFVPAGARSLEVEVVRPAFRGFAGEPSRPRRARRLSTVDPRAVAAAARLIDELPLAEPAGPVPSCPAESVADSAAPLRMMLTFRAAPFARILARVRSDVGAVCARTGEATAQIVLPGRPAVALTDQLNGIAASDAAPLSGRVEAALGRSLRLG